MKDCVINRLIKADILKTEFKGRDLPPYRGTFFHVYIFIHNYPFTTGAPADGIPVSMSNIYHTNKYVLYANILSKKIYMTCTINDI